MLLAFVFALYLLAKKEVVAAHLKRLTETVLPPRSARCFLSIVRLTNQTFSNFVSGQLTEAAIIGFLCFAGMQLEGNLIYPRVVGKSVGLPGILVLMAVTIGGEAFGVLGMLFSVPVCAVLYSLYLEFMKNRPHHDAPLE